MIAEVSQPSSETMLAQLEIILSSPSFRASLRLKRFLRYIVEETLAGRHKQIKGYTIAVDIFGRPKDFNPQRDPIVSVEARRLRRALEHYYLTDGCNDRWRIDIPTGCYIPTFTKNEVRKYGEKASRSYSPSAQLAESASLALAVLPFEYRGDDPAKAFFAEGIAEELAIALSKFQGLRVVAPLSVLNAREQQPDLEKAVHELGVRFVLHGSVNKYGDQIRLTAKLTDTMSHVLLWAEAFQGNMSTSGLFEIQAEVIRKIVLTVGNDYGVILHTLISNAQRKRPEDLKSYEATLLYHHYNLTFGPEAHARAQKALEHAVEIDPQYAIGWAQLGILYGDAFTLGYDCAENLLARTDACSRRAMALAPEYQETRSATAFAHFLQHQHQDAVHHAEKAIRLNPNNANFVCFCGFFIGLSGELVRGRKIIEDVWRLDPHLPGWLRTVAFVDDLIHGRYEPALQEAQRFRAPNLPWDAMLRAAAAGQMGEKSVMVSAYSELVREFPDVAKNPEDTIRKYFHFDPWVDAMLNGLEKSRKAAGI